MPRLNGQYRPSSGLVQSSGSNIFGTGSILGTGLNYSTSDNPMIDAYYQANPFVGQTYKFTLWDKLFGGIFRTGYDKWKDEMALNAAQYDASVVDLEQQLAYNDPSATASRERAAGLNPDLVGLDDASNSSGLTPDVQDAQIPEAFEPAQILSIASSVGNAVLGIVPGVMSFMTNLSSLRGLRLQNDATELAFGQSAVDAASKFFTEGITKDMYEAAFNSGDFSNILDASKKDSDYLTNTFLSSKSARQKFKLAYGMHANSLISDMEKYKTYAEYEDARKKNLSQRSSAFFDDDDDVQMDLIKSILQPYERYQKRINDINERIANLRKPELEQGVVNAELSNDLAYEQALDRTKEAGAENAGYDYQKQLYEIQKATDDMFAEMMKSLDEKDKWYTPIAKAMIGIARAQLLSGIHMQFGRRSSSYSGPNSSASSEGFNFGF